MSNHTTRRRVLQVAGSATLAGLAGCSSSGSSDGTTNPEGSVPIQVRVENVAPTDFYPSDASTGGAVWLSPGAYVVQEGFDRPIPTSEPASVGLEALAEAGLPTGFDGETGLVEELSAAENTAGAGAVTPNATVADPNDPTGEVPGAAPIAPGGAFEFTIEVEDSQQLLFAFMLLPSNDVFLAPEDWITPWPADATPVEGSVTDSLALWDAGTEPNGQPGFGPDQPPTQNASDQGADEDATVRPLSEVDDGFDYPAVEDLVEVTLTTQ